MRIYMEIRNCAGGLESGLFANELLSVYVKYAKKNNIHCELISEGKTKMVLFEGKSKLIDPLLNEGGIHRVQRISETGKKGKIHTSTVSIATLEVNTESPVIINDRDLKIDTYRGSGKGGQHRNVTDSAVRITHIPTGTVVVCENERSQYQNKEFAMEILKSRIQNSIKSKECQIINTKRHNQVGSGDRAEARRTYNYMRSEVYDHITNKNCSLKEFMDKANLIALK